MVFFSTVNLQMWLMKRSHESGGIITFFMIFWVCCSVWTVGLDLKIMSVKTFMINEKSLFLCLESSCDYWDKL